jgi:hypothetical protein
VMHAAVSASIYVFVQSRFHRPPKAVALPRALQSFAKK